MARVVDTLDVRPEARRDAVHVYGIDPDRRMRERVRRQPEHPRRTPSATPGRHRYQRPVVEPETYGPLIATNTHVRLSG
jgi:hypothetical protein